MREYAAYLHSRHSVRITQHNFLHLQRYHHTFHHMQQHQRHMCWNFYVFTNQRTASFAGFTATSNLLRCSLMLYQNCSMALYMCCCTSSSRYQCCCQNHLLSAMQVISAATLTCIARCTSTTLQHIAGTLSSGRLVLCIHMQNNSQTNDTIPHAVP